MNKGKPTYQELEKRLAAAEPIVEALKHHEVDAVVGEKKIAFLLLREVTEALRDSEAGFRAMFDLPGIGMVQANTPDFHFTRINQKFCEMIGYTAEELQAKTFISLTDPQDRRRAMNEFVRVLRGKSDSWSIEKRFVRKDGSVIWVSVNGVALRDETGQVVKVTAMISDITARKLTEEELRDQSKRLRRLASELERFKLAAVKEIRKSAVASPPHKPRLKRLQPRPRPKTS